MSFCLFSESVYAFRSMHDFHMTFRCHPRHRRRHRRCCCYVCFVLAVFAQTPIPLRHSFAWIFWFGIFVGHLWPSQRCYSHYYTVFRILFYVKFPYYLYEVSVKISFYVYHNNFAMPSYTQSHEMALVLCILNENWLGFVWIVSQWKSCCWSIDIKGHNGRIHRFRHKKTFHINLYKVFLCVCACALSSFVQGDREWCVL